MVAGERIKACVEFRFFSLIELGITVTKADAAFCSKDVETKAEKTTATAHVKTYVGAVFCGIMSAKVSHCIFIILKQAAHNRFFQIFIEQKSDDVYKMCSVVQEAVSSIFAHMSLATSCV